MNKELKEKIEEILKWYKEPDFAGDTAMKILNFNKTDEAVGQLLTLIQEERADAVKVTGETSDGYHTFNELYAFRRVFNALLFNEWSVKGLYKVHKSKKHNDGEDCFGGGWFIVMATLPTGQISNHYELKDWDLFQCEEREVADKWDGHTAQDVLIRLEGHLKQPTKKNI